MAFINKTRVLVGIVIFKTVLINQFVSPTFCVCFAFCGINFRGMLNHVCNVPMMKTCMDQPELINVGAQID